MLQILISYDLVILSKTALFYSRGDVVTPIDWKTAFNLFFDRGWLRLAVFSFAGFLLAGIRGSILFTLVVIVMGVLIFRFSLLCNKCHAVVERTHNFCLNCANPVPEELRREKPPDLEPPTNP